MWCFGDEVVIGLLNDFKVIMMILWCEDVVVVCDFVLSVLILVEVEMLMYWYGVLVDEVVVLDFDGFDLRGWIIYLLLGVFLDEGCEMVWIVK